METQSFLKIWEQGKGHQAKEAVYTDHFLGADDKFFSYMKDRSYIGYKGLRIFLSSELNLLVSVMFTALSKGLCVIALLRVLVVAFLVLSGFGA